MQNKWLQWFLDTFGDPPEKVKAVWEELADRITEERLKIGGSLEFFHARSCLLPFLLAKREMCNLAYYQQLRECLHIRPVRKAQPVFVLGPTSGGEIETIGAAGGKPYLIQEASTPWRTVCEERLFDNRVWFENATFDDFFQNVVNFRYVVISPWVADPVEALASSYNALGEHGFVSFPANQTKMVDAATSLGLRRQDDFQKAVAVYFKYPGAHDVCDEK